MIPKELLKTPKSQEDLFVMLGHLTREKKIKAQGHDIVFPRTAEFSDEYGNIWKTAKELEPGVIHRVEKQKAGEVQYLGNTHLPMVDWDWPDAIHSEGAVTVKHAGDAIRKLTNYTQADPSSRFRVYLTPGGLHAFDVSKRATPREYFSNRLVAEGLQPDPYYQKISQQRIPVPGMVGPQDGIFYSRVSPKPERTNDFVAAYVGDVGRGRANPASIRQMEQHHDPRLVEPNLQKKEDIQALLRQQLQYVDPGIKSQWSDQLARFGIHDY